MADQLPSVAVVILCWKGRSLLEQFLPSVIRHTPPTAEIVVADNASGDGTAELLQNSFPQITFIALEKNLGFAGGYNAVINRLHHDIIIMLNQDVEVTASWLEPLVLMLLREADTGAVQPRIRSWRQRQLFEYAGAAGGWIDLFGYTFCRGRLFDVLEADRNQYNLPADIFWASGACMAIRRSVYVQAGGLDPDFFAHMEEIDLCWRLKNRGLRIRYCPDSVVYHQGGSALPQGHPFKTYLNYRNNLLMLVKNLPVREALVIVPARMVLDGISALRSVLRGYPRDVPAIARAHWHFLRKLPHLRRPAPRKSLWRHSGVYRASLVWAFFIRRKRYFAQLFAAAARSSSSSTARA